MKKIVFIFLLVSMQSLAAPLFYSYVEPDPSGRHLVLYLNLEDTEARGEPDFTELQQQFNLQGVSKSQSTQIVNGHFSRQFSWQIRLLPLQDAKEIPGISIKTKHGMLQTEPIAELPLQQIDVEVPVKLRVIMEQSNVYEQEAILLRVQLFSKQPVLRWHLEPLQVTNAVVEDPDFKRSYSIVESGQKLQVQEVGFILTPLAAGELNIPAAAAYVELRAKQQFKNFGMFSLFDNLNTVESYQVRSEVNKLVVKPAQSECEPWLPAEDLTLQLDTNSGVARQGEPITLTAKLQAKGIAATALPEIAPLLKLANAKVYADAAVNNTKVYVDPLKVVSISEQQISIVAENSSQVDIPRLSLSWWDITTNSLRQVNTEAFTIELQAKLPQELENAATAVSLQPQITETHGAASLVKTIKDNWYYAVIILFLLGYCLWLQYKLKTVGRAKNKFKTMENITSINELKAAMYDCLASKGIKLQDLSLLVPALAAKGIACNEKIAVDLANKIQSNLYFGKSVELFKLKAMWQELQDSLHKNVKVATSSQTKPLNPT